MRGEVHVHERIRSKQLNIFTALLVAVADALLRVGKLMRSETTAPVPLLPPSAPFNAQQRAWLNGYFAGLTSFADGRGGAADAGGGTIAVAKKSLLVLFGSQSGTAEGLAKKLVKQANAGAFAARLMEANGCSIEELAATERLLLVTSTWGDGDAPDNAAQLLIRLTASDAPRLEKLSFSVLTIGDKNYSEFCGAGRKFDAAFEKLGARRVHPRVDCDLDYEAAAGAWIAGALVKVGEVISETVISNQSANAGTEASLLITDY